MATLWRIRNNDKKFLASDPGRFAATFAVCHPGRWEGRFIREGIMDTDRLWNAQVNWIRFFDTSLLITGFISVASVALQLL